MLTITALAPSAAAETPVRLADGIDALIRHFEARVKPPPKAQQPPPALTPPSLPKLVTPRTERAAIELIPLGEAPIDRRVAQAVTAVQADLPEGRALMAAALKAALAIDHEEEHAPAPRPPVRRPPEDEEAPECGEESCPRWSVRDRPLLHLGAAFLALDRTGALARPGGPNRVVSGAGAVPEALDWGLERVHAGPTCRSRPCRRWIGL